MTNQTDDILAKAANLVSNDRAALYGDSNDLHERLAMALTALLRPKLVEGVEIEAREVLLFMAALKGIRATVSPELEDNYVDGAGYMALAGAGECVD